MPDTLHLDWLSQFHLLRPAWLLLILPLLLLALRLRQPRQQMQGWQRHMSTEMIAALTISGDEARRLRPHNLLLPLGLLLIIALAGPSWYRHNSPLSVDQSVLTIALNVSSSMQTSDLSPSRLLRAKQKIDTLLKRRGDAKTALIAYAGSAHIAMPVTDDNEMVRHFINALRPEVMPIAGNAPVKVLAHAQKMFAETGHPGTLLLLTDDTPATAFQPYRAYFEHSMDKLIIWQIGSLRAEQGLTVAQQQRHAALAQVSNGIVVPISTDDTDVDTVLHAIDNQMKTVNNSNQPWFDFGYPVFWLLTPLALLWFRRGWVVTWQ